MKRFTVRCALGAALLLGLSHCGSSSNEGATPSGAAGSSDGGALSGVGGSSVAGAGGSTGGESPAGAGGSSGGGGSSGAGSSAGGGLGGAGAGHAGSSGTAGTAGGVPCGDQTCSSDQYCRAPCSGTFTTGGFGAVAPSPSCSALPPLCDGTPTCDCICGGVSFWCSTGSETIPRTAAVQCGCA